MRQQSARRRQPSRTPVPGAVEIAQRATTTTELPAGQTRHDIEVEITAPDATPEEPLVLGFEIDATVIEGADPDRLAVFRNGAPVPSCTSDTAAVPDPCLAVSRTQDDGDVEVTVRTSRASTWNFATVNSACPTGFVSSVGFSDVADGSPHAASIDCAAWWDTVSGRGDGRYEPADHVTRGQFATSLVSMLEALGTDLPQPGSRFADDHATHGDSAEVLAAMDLVSGGADGRYGYTDPVTRAQMATFLTTAFERLSSTPVDARPEPYVDVNEGIHADAIAKAAEADLIRGTTVVTYDPEEAVTRAQLASFLTNLAEQLVSRGHADPPL